MVNFDIIDTKTRSSIFSSINECDPVIGNGIVSCLFIILTGDLNICKLILILYIYYYLMHNYHI